MDPKDLGKRITNASRAEGMPAGPEQPSDTPTLDEYGRDMTEEAKAGKLDPVVGRADEIEQTVEILSRRTKNNPVLIGDPGVGKTAIVEGLAQRIVVRRRPQDAGGQARRGAGPGRRWSPASKYRGEFEERLKNVIDEVGKAAGLHDPVHRRAAHGRRRGLRRRGLDGRRQHPQAGALARGELHVVGATTIDEYRKNIEKDAALERRFQPVLIAEPTVEETVQILEGLRDALRGAPPGEVHRRGAPGRGGELSDRYISDRFLPDKAIDLIDQAGARVRLRSLGKSTEAIEREDKLAKLAPRARPGRVGRRTTTGPSVEGPDRPGSATSSPPSRSAARAP